MSATMRILAFEFRQKNFLLVCISIIYTPRVYVIMSFNNVTYFCAVARAVKKNYSIFPLTSFVSSYRNLFHSLVAANKRQQKKKKRKNLADSEAFMSTHNLRNISFPYR